MSSSSTGAAGVAGVAGVSVQTAELEQLLSEIVAKATDLRRPFRGQIGPDIAQHLERQYESRGTHLGTPWKPLRLSTIRARTRRLAAGRGKNAKGARTTTKRGRGRAGFSTPMQDTLTSRGAFTKLATPLGVRVYDRQSMEWGADVPYMAPHHDPNGFTLYPFGNTKAKPVHVAPRYVIVPSELWPDSIVGGWAQVILNHVTGGITP